jgi:hypothetical protein
VSLADAKRAKYVIQHILYADSAGNAPERAHGQPQLLTTQFRQRGHLSSAQRSGRLGKGSNMPRPAECCAATDNR